MSSDRSANKPFISLIFQSPLRLCIVCMLLGAMLTLPYLGHLRLSNEEPRRALIADNMLASGEYLTPRDMGRYYMAKPPLYNWLIVASSAAKGYVTEFSARITSVVALLLLTALLIFGMRTRLHKAGLSFLAFATLLSPQMLTKSTLAEIELVFTLAVTLSLWVWYWNYDRGARGFALWLLPTFITALSFLSKREPAFVFFYFAVAGFLIYKRDIKLLIQPAHLVCVAIMLAISSVWFVAVISAVGIDEFLVSMQREVLGRGLDEGWQPLLQHLLFYPVEVMFSAFPFSLLLLPLLSRQFRDRVYRRYGDISVFALIAVLINLPIYWFRADAAVRYFMPMLPTALVLAALVYQMLVEDAEDEKPGRWILFTVWGTALLCLILALAPVVVVAIPQLTESLGSLVLPIWMIVASSAIYLSLVILAVTKIGRHFQVNLLTFFVLFILGFRLLYFDVLLPTRAAKLDEERNLPLFSQQITNLVPAEAFPIDSIGDMQRDVWFYLGRDKLKNISSLDKTEAISHFPSGYFLVFSSDIDVYLKGFDDQWETIHSIRYRDRDLILGKAK